MCDFSFPQNLSWARPALSFVEWIEGAGIHFFNNKDINANNFSPTDSNRTQLGIFENKFLD